MTLDTFMRILEITTSLSFIVTAIYGIISLRLFVDQLRIARGDSTLAFEQDVSDRREKFVEAAEQLRKAKATRSADLDAIKRHHDVVKENYLYAVDRLASCICRGQFDPEDAQNDYGDFIRDIVVSFADDFSGASRYRNIVKLHKKWFGGPS